MTDKDAEFPWKAWLSGLPTVAETIAVQALDDIREFELAVAHSSLLFAALLDNLLGLLVGSDCIPILNCS